MRRAAWLLLAALACCARATNPAQEGGMTEAGTPPAMCRVGPDGRRLAERGIGGTGGPPVETAERGIGGTGIIGVITGFASVCVAGEEIGLPPGVAARMDDGPATLDDLRAGQLIALEAAGPPGALRARQIAIRHAAIGPVEAAGPGSLTVAGQYVTVAAATGAAVAAKPGQWVAVSGLRQDGTNIIDATRIDPAPPGRVLVRGELVRIYGAARVGSLSVILPDSFAVPAGFPVVLAGRLQDGALVVDSAARDLAAESPSAYFGPAVSSFIVEASIAGVAGGYLVSRDFVSGRGFTAPGERGRAVARFTRTPSGLAATGLRPFGAAGDAGRGAFTPAPTVPGPATERPGPGGGFGGTSLGTGLGNNPGSGEGAPRPGPSGGPGRR